MNHCAGNTSHSYFVQKIRNSTLLSGAMILTVASVTTKCIGFLFRVYLSRQFSAEQIGIYQLVTPLLSIIYTLSVSGIRTAISQMTAALSAKDSFKTGDSRVVLALGLLLSLGCSILLSTILYLHADFFAVSYLKEKRTQPLIKVLALSFPVSAIHSCITGYYIGLKKAAFPAVSQLLEQIVRVITVVVLCNLAPDIHIVYAIAGIVAGETCSAFLSILVFYKQMHTNSVKFSQHNYLAKLLMLSFPLTLSRIIQTIIQSAEAIAIPHALQQYGYSKAAALSNYGILTGMVLPLILFPTALTNSISAMLLPTISEAQALQDHKRIRYYLIRCIQGCLLLGLGFTGILLLFGNFISHTLFQQTLASPYIKTISFICPFLYINGTLTGILHGLGKTFSLFVLHCLSLLVRLMMVYLAVPRYGMQSYLLALLLSQCLLLGLQIPTILCSLKILNLPIYRR